MTTFLQQETSQPSKLRSSCDACGIAKVKCDRGSECGRCKAMSLDCVYGLSRKFGKPQRKRPRTDFNMPSQLHTTSSTTDVSFAEFPRSSRALLPATTLGAADHSTLGPTFFNPLPLDDINWSEFGSLNTGLGNSTTTEAQDLSLATTPTDTSSRTRDTHDCPQEAYNILGTLTSPHARPEVPPDSIKDTVLTHLDFVLSNNKNAIDRLDRLLDCDCTKSPHLAMLYASIISRILIWYQQAAGLSTSYRITIPATSCPHKDTSTTSIPKHLATSIPVGEPLFSIGMFNVEEPCLQFIFRCQLIFNELRRTYTLIDRFISKGSGETSANGVEGLYISLGAWLKEERVQIAEALWSTIKKMSDAVDPRDI